MVEIEEVSKGQFKGFLNGLETISKSSAQSTVQVDELMEKYVHIILKFDKVQMIAVTEHWHVLKIKAVQQIICLYY